LVIGGAGSIGSAFIKALLPYKPASLTVVDTNENALAELTRELRSSPGLYMPEKYTTYPLCFCDRIFEKIVRRNKGFNIVTNFAAHKHVRSEKDIYAVEAMLQNNVLRVGKMLDLLAEYPPEKFFCVSTDKAANPVNIMGGKQEDNGRPNILLFRFFHCKYRPLRKCGVFKRFVAGGVYRADKQTAAHKRAAGHPALFCVAQRER